MDFNGCSDPNCSVCGLFRRIQAMPGIAPGEEMVAEPDPDQQVIYSAMWSMLGMDSGPTTEAEAVDPKIMFPLVRRLFQAQQQAISALSDSLDIAHDVYLGIRSRVVTLEERLSALENKG